MKKIIFLLILIITLFLFGCVTNIQKPSVKGTNCDTNQNCLLKNFNECNKAYGKIIDGNESLFVQILEKENEKCSVYIELKKSTRVPEFLFGMNAKCTLKINELTEVLEKMNIEDLDCEGPLYDALKSAKESGLIQ